MVVTAVMTEVTAVMATPVMAEMMAEVAAVAVMAVVMTVMTAIAAVLDLREGGGRAGDLRRDHGGGRLGALGRGDEHGADHGQHDGQGPDQTGTGCVAHMGLLTPRGAGLARTSSLAGQVSGVERTMGPDGFIEARFFFWPIVLKGG